MKWDRLCGLRMSLGAGPVIELPQIDIPGYQDYRALHSPTDDQGNQSACAGFATADWLEVQHWIETGTGGKQYPALEIYQRAKMLDGDNQDGTTLDHAAMAAMELGFIPPAASIRHVRGFRSIAQILHRQRCAITGFNINDNWRGTGPDGFIGRADCANIGGHAVAVDSYHIYLKPGGSLRDDTTWDIDRSWVGWHNSWGDRWGIGGHGRMTLRQYNASILDAVWIE